MVKNAFKIFLYIIICVWGCVCICVCVLGLVQLCDSMDPSPSGSSVHGIL